MRKSIIALLLVGTLFVLATLEVAEARRGGKDGEGNEDVSIGNNGKKGNLSCKGKGKCDDEEPSKKKNKEELKETKGKAGKKGKEGKNLPQKGTKRGKTICTTTKKSKKATKRGQTTVRPTRQSRTSTIPAWLTSSTQLDSQPTSTDATSTVTSRSAESTTATEPATRTTTTEPTTTTTEATTTPPEPTTTSTTLEPTTTTTAESTSTTTTTEATTATSTTLEPTTTPTLAAVSAEEDEPSAPIKVPAGTPINKIKQAEDGAGTGSGNETGSKQKDEDCKDGRTKPTIPAGRGRGGGSLSKISKGIKQALSKIAAAKSGNRKP